MSQGQFLRAQGKHQVIMVLMPIGAVWISDRQAQDVPSRRQGGDTGGDP